MTKFLVRTTVLVDEDPLMSKRNDASDWYVISGGEMNFELLAETSNQVAIPLDRLWR